MIDESAIRLRFAVLGFFSLTVIIYGIKHGVSGFQTSQLTPTGAIFLGLVPLLLFNYVGFELQNGAAEEMENPQKDVPLSVLRSGVTGVLMYVIPIFCILLVLPASKVTGIGGFISAVTLTFHGVYGGAAHALLIVMTLFKGKVWTGLLGIFLPVLALVGAIRLARPDSAWARWRYRPDGKKARRALRRDDQTRQWFVNIRTKVQDALAGRPSS